MGLRSAVEKSDGNQAVDDVRASPNALRFPGKALPISAQETGGLCQQLRR
jgi:hypothetical protein